MASIHRGFTVEAPVTDVWDAIRDVGAVHRRLARDFVVDTTLEADARVVTFANGVVVRELIVSIDEEQRRVSYAVVGGRPTHHHASMQVAADGEHKTRFVWITDLLPDELAGELQVMIEMGMEAMRKTLETRAP